MEKKLKCPPDFSDEDFKALRAKMFLKADFGDKILKVTRWGLDKGLTLKEIQTILISKAVHYSRFQGDQDDKVKTREEVEQNPVSMEERGARFAALFNSWAEEDLIDYRVVPLKRDKG